MAVWLAFGVLLLAQQPQINDTGASAADKRVSIIDLANGSIASNVSSATSLNVSMQLDAELSWGKREGTPTNFTIRSASVSNGYWNDRHGCCSYNWQDLYYRPNPEVVWDGLPDATRSVVILLDGIEENAQVYWLVTNIDPREHIFRDGTSGQCDQWQMRYRGCPPGRIPAAAFERQNFNGWFKFSALCPPGRDTHKYRLRVFAQSEFNQDGTDFRGIINPPSINGDDIARKLMATNVGVATIIGKFSRPKNCGGPSLKDFQAKDPVLGLVADYDFNTRSFYSSIDGPRPIEDIGSYCAMSSRFVADNVRGTPSNVLDFMGGTGVVVRDVDLILRKDNDKSSDIQYSIAMDIFMRNTNCWVRLLNVKPDSSGGVYLCGQAGVTIKGGSGNTISGGAVYPNQWYHIVIATKASGEVNVYVNGAPVIQGSMSANDWQQSMIIQRPASNTPEGRAPPYYVPYMSFFNDCGDSCNCQNGGGSQSAGRVKRIQLFNRMISASEVDVLWAKANDPSPDLSLRK